MLRNVLDRSRRQRHHRFALLPNKSQVRGLLGGSLKNGVIIHIYVAHPCGLPIMLLMMLAPMIASNGH
jgi:hypothetical protein